MNCDSTTHKTVIVYIILVSWGDNLKNSHTISQQKNYSTKKKSPKLYPRYSVTLYQIIKTEF